MGEISDFFFKTFKGHPFDIVFNTLTYMRVLLLLICTYFLYYNFIEHFTVCKTVDEVLLFFIELTFVKCIIVYLFVVLFLDTFTKCLIILIFYILTIPLFKKANRQNKNYLNIKKDLSKSIKNSILHFEQKVGNVLNRNVSLYPLKKITSNQFDNLLLIIVQICYVNYLSNYNYKYVYILCLVVFLITFFLKSYLLYAEKLFKNIIL